MERHSLLPPTAVSQLVERRREADTCVVRAGALASVVVQFLSCARRHPSRAAVLFGARVVSYGELLQAGLRVAAAIRRRLASVTPLSSSEAGEVRLSNIVCVSCERSVELIVSMMAIQLAGAVYCPVHPQLPVKRKAELYTQTECALVLTLTRHAQSVREALDTADSVLDCTVLEVDELLTRPADVRDGAQLPDEQQLRELEDLSRPAYAIFTSGTTGKPKAAVISHRALATMTFSTFSVDVLQADDIVLQVAEVTFDPPRVGGVQCAGHGMHGLHATAWWPAGRPTHAGHHCSAPGDSDGLRPGYLAPSSGVVRRRAYLGSTEVAPSALQRRRGVRPGHHPSLRCLPSSDEAHQPVRTCGGRRDSHDVCGHCRGPRGQEPQHGPHRSCAAAVLPATWCTRTPSAQWRTAWWASCC